MTRDYIVVEDVATANFLAIEIDLSRHPDPVFNVSTQVPTTTNRIFAVIREKIGSSIDAV